MSVRILNADCLTALPELAAEGFRAHAVVTDPPYGLEFMGVGWDTFSDRPKGSARPRNEWQDFGSREHPRLASEQARIVGNKNRAFQAWADTWVGLLADCMLPGAHLVAFGSPRTYHRLVCAIEDAGFEVRDTLLWLHGQGFPKSKSQLKPAFEPIILARKPLAGTVAANTIKHGCGGLNIDAARIPIGGDGSHHTVATSQGGARSSHVDSTVCTCSAHEASQGGHSRDTHNRVSASSGRGEHASRPASERTHDRLGLGPQGSPVDCLPYRHSDDVHARAEEEVDQASLPQPRGGDRSPDHCAKCGRSRATSMPYGTIPNIQPQGRWPANVLHDGSPEVEEAFARFGDLTSGSRDGKRKAHSEFGTFCERERDSGYARTGDTGSASRFYFTAKADAADRAGSKHPTVKPTSLMRWLVQLVCPPNGTVLDPFAGTGSTGLAADQLGMNAILIERDPTYAADARRKIASDAPLFTEVA